MQTSFSSSSEKALILSIEFFEAHFKVHYTKGFRLTYPIPLPTSVAGIFASMLGMDGKEAVKKFKNCRFGSMLVKGKYNETIEYSTFLQHAKNRKIVVRTHIIVNPTYYIAIQCSNVPKIHNDIAKGIEYLPFGGQNDFFAKDWNIMGVTDVYNSIQISNYLHGGHIQELTKGVSLEILPVMHKFGGKEEFYFIIDGHLISKQEMPVCSIDNRNMALYRLDDFYPVGAWKEEGDDDQV